MVLRMFDIVQVDLGITIGSEQGKERPAVVIQNNMGNKYSPTILIVPLTTEIKNLHLPTHRILFKSKSNGLTEMSMLMGEQIRVVDKSRIQYKRGYLSTESEKASVIQVYLANITGRKNSSLT